LLIRSARNNPLRRRSLIKLWITRSREASSEAVRLHACAKRDSRDRDSSYETWSDFLISSGIRRIIKWIRDILTMMEGYKIAAKRQYIPLDLHLFSYFRESSIFKELATVVSKSDWHDKHN